MHPRTSLFAIVGLALAGCSSGDPGPSPRGTGVALKGGVPGGLAGSAVTDFVLLAQHDVTVHDHVQVLGGSVGASGLPAKRFDKKERYPIQVHDHSAVSVGHTLVAPGVRLDDHSTAGDVEADELDAHDSTYGALSGLGPLPPLPAAATVVPGTRNYHLDHRGTATLPAGANLREVEVNDDAILRLSGGTYQLRTLHVHARARVEALAPVDILISDELHVEDQAYLGPAGGTALAAGAVRVQVTGPDKHPPDDPHKVAHFHGRSTVAAHVYAPYGSIEFEDNTLASGVFMAYDIEVHGHSTVRLDGGASGCPSTCDDGNPCTADACAAGHCVNDPRPSGTSCSDGDVCNGLEACDGSGTCASGTPPVLDDNNPCTADGCDPQSGPTHTPVAGIACSDGNACNGLELCDADGACQPGTPIVVDDGNPCTADSCDPVLGRVNTPIVGLACSDGNACNGLETCDPTGACAPGTPPAIDDGNPCTIDTCAPATGAISHTPAPPWTMCGPAPNACTQPSICDGAGACVAGITVNPDDHNPCTMDTCRNGLPVNTPLANGSPCEDGNLCTSGTTCQSGACVGGAQTPCTALDQCHVPGTCDPATGLCSNPSKLTGTPCDDGIACTNNDACVNGTCAGSRMPDGASCGPGSICLLASCQSVCLVGGTVYQPGGTRAGGDPCMTCQPSVSTSALSPLADGTGCGGGMICGLGSCVSGCLIGGTLVSGGAPDPNNACRSCQPLLSTTGYSANADGSACLNGGTCAAGACHCPAGMIQCGTQCVDPMVDNGNCNGCGNVCSGGTSCEAGSCQLPLKPMTVSRYALGAATYPGGPIYAIGGFTAANNTGESRAVEAYDPGTLSWTMVASMPTARGGVVAVGVKIGTSLRIFAFGGMSGGSVLNKVESYDPGVNVWATATPMPTARAFAAAALGSDGKIYVIGGRSNTGPLTTVESYDPVLNKWNTAAPAVVLPQLNTAREKLAAAAGSDGRIYALGGMGTGGGQLSSVEALVPGGTAWNASAPLPASRSQLGAASGSDGRIYAVGGFTNDVTHLVNAYAAPPTNAWTTVSALNDARTFPGVVAGSDGRIYAMGGMAMSPTNLLEIYVPAADFWLK